MGLAPDDEATVAARGPDHGAPARGSLGQESGEGEPRPPFTTGAMWLLGHGQDIVTLVVGAVLVLVSAALLVSGIVDFFRQVTGSTAVITAANDLLDRLLLVLILVEIVHTVVLSLRAHTLVPQPFVVVGLVAVIRKILFVLGNSSKVATSQLALYLAMVAVFVAGLIAIRFSDDRSAARAAELGAEAATTRSRAATDRLDH